MRKRTPSIALGATAAPVPLLLAMLIAMQSAVADSPDVETLHATGWPAATGDPAAFARRVGELVGRGVSVVVTERRQFFASSTRRAASA